jgi:hypothetical protein
MDSLLSKLNIILCIYDYLKFEENTRGKIDKEKVRKSIPHEWIKLHTNPLNEKMNENVKKSYVTNNQFD